MLTDKNAARIIFITSLIVIFYSQIIVWQNYLAERAGKRPELNFMDPEYHLQRGMDSESEEEFKKAIRLNPTNARAYHELANYYVNKSELKQAAGEYSKVLALSQ